MFGTSKLLPSKLTSVFFAVNRPNIIGSDDGNVVQFDAFVRESHTVESDLTSYPVETGELITDHIIDKPRELIIKAISTNTPIQLGGGIGNAVESITNLIQNPFKDTGQIVSKAGRAWNNLISQLRKKTPVNITTILGYYDSMILTGLSAESDEDTGEDLFVTMTFKELFYLTEDGISSNIDRMKNPSIFDKFTDSNYGHKDLLEFS